MCYRKTFYLFILLLLTQFFVHAGQEIYMEKVEAEGLTNYYIKCITQDQRGFLWFGTEEGLFRYNGYDFEAVKNLPGDGRTISNNNIEFLMPGTKDTLWVGTRGGLSCVDSKTLEVKNFPASQAFTVYAIAKKDDHSFYVGTSAGLFEFSKKTHAWEQEDGFPKNIFIRSLTSDGNGNLFATSHQGLYEFNVLTKSTRHFDIPGTRGQKGKTLQIAHRSILGKNGNIWITTWNAGLLEFNVNTGKFSAYFAPNLDKTLEEYRGSYDLFEDADANVWMANSENGVTVIHPGLHTASSFRVQWDSEKQIADRVYALYRDRSGICWIGTENGIYKHDPRSVHFTTINFFPTRNKKPLRPDFTALCTMKDKDGDWWMGAYEGLFLFDSLTGELKDYSAAAGIPEGTNIFNIFQDSAGEIWLTARNQLMSLKKMRLNGKVSFKNKTYAYPPMQSTIMVACRDRHKRFWLGTNSNGLFMFDPASGGFTSFPAINKNEIRGLYELPDESILVGGVRMGLLRLYPKVNTVEKVNLFRKMENGKDMTINAISGDGQDIWIGADGNGLWRTDEKLTELHQYTIRDGFPSMNINALLPAKNDHLWIISEGGVIDYRPLHKKIRLFDKSAGIRNMYNIFFISEMENGTIAIGDMGCLHLYHPTEKEKDPPVPAAMITGFKIFDSSCRFAENSIVELNHNQNYFSFEYLALNYTQPSQTRYAYMLEGIDNKWNDAGTRRYISYTNLNEGDYTFKVRSGNSEGIWNETPAILRLIIRPPFWHRWWFYVLVITSVLLLAYYFYFTRRRRLLDKEELRNKIASDLHDDIGSTLSGINIFSKIALQKLKTDQQASGDLLQKINRRTEKTMEALSDIVWSINTGKDNMENVLSRMREYLGEVIESQGIRYEFLVDEPVHQVHIGMEKRKEMYLIFKEAVHNASKYAACSLISITLKKENRMVILSIADNGKGFDIRSIIPGNGINNMQLRAKKIRGSFEIYSGPEDGTKIFLTFPIT